MLIILITSPLYVLIVSQDSVYVLASALKEMMVNETITEAPKDCDDSGVFWETGKKLFHYLKTRNINGKTGRVVLITYIYILFLLLYNTNPNIFYLSSLLLLSTLLHLHFMEYYN